MVFKTNYRLLQGKSIVECSIKQPFVIKIVVLSIFEWLLKTGFTVVSNLCGNKLTKSEDNSCSLHCMNGHFF